MNIYFDIDIIDSQIFGMTYATLELMKALHNNGYSVTNFVSGRKKHLKNHLAIMKKYGFPVHVCHIPKKLNRLFPLLSLAEYRSHRHYDYFIQIGLHRKRNIPKNKYILFIHDTVGLRYPENEAPFPDNAQEMIDQAAMILTVSEFSKSEILHFFDIAPEKVQVVPNGCDLSRFKLADDKDIKRITKTYNLPGPYFVAYGGKSPRKNIPFLLDAYEKFIHKNPSAPTLVLFGQSIDIPNALSHIIQIGYVPDEDVPIILSGAKALIFPSYYEGFGLPILEAFACKTSVICAKSSSLPEVSQGNVLFFDPESSDSFMAALTQFLADDSIYQDLINKGMKIARSQSWKNSAVQLVSVLNDKLAKG
jgi:glycosyltransferase involved in cell wall biosynthesis